MSSIRHITVAKRFTASGVACGIKESGRPDVAIIACDSDASAAIVTTTNQVVGAPVLWCRNVLPKGFGKVRAIVINSGNSNAFTGRNGAESVHQITTAVAAATGVSETRVFTSSTGVIGEPLPHDRIVAKLSELNSGLQDSSIEQAAAAIMTTDTFT